MSREKLLVTPASGFTTGEAWQRVAAIVRSVVLASDRKQAVYFFVYYTTGPNEMCGKIELGSFASHMLASLDSVYPHRKTVV